MKKSILSTIFVCFLFIYFIMPGDVFAVVAAPTHGSCKCTGPDDVTANLSISYTQWSNGTASTYTNEISYSGLKWGGNLNNVLSRPSNNYHDTLGLQPGECPYMVVKKITLNKSKLSTGYENKDEFEGKVYYYTNQSDASSWANTNHNCSNFGEIAPVLAFSYGSACVNVESIMLTCKPIEKSSSGGNVVAPNLSQSKQSCESVFGNANDPEHKSVAWILQTLFNYIRIIGVLLVIVFSGLDFTKVIISNDHEAWRKAQHKLSLRMMGVIALLLLPVLINFMLGLFISGTVTDFTCGIG